jgi:hypothetical protein
VIKRRLYLLIAWVLRHSYDSVIIPAPWHNEKRCLIEWESGHFWLVDVTESPGLRIRASTNHPTWLKNWKDAA